MSIKQRKRPKNQVPEQFSILPNQIIPEVELRVGNSYTDVVGMPGGPVYEYFKNTLSYQTEGHIWSNRGDWDGKISLVCRGGRWCRCSHKSPYIHFPTGLLYMAKEFLTIAAKSVKITDTRSLPKQNKNWSFAENVELRDYQKECVDLAIAKGRGIIKAATGAGKTVICAGIMQALQRSPVLFLVTSVDLMNQAADEFERFLRENGKKPSVGRIGDSKCIFGDINVMTVQTAVRCLGMKYESFDDEDESEEKSFLEDTNKIKTLDLIRKAPVLFCDEVQHWAAQTCQAVSNECSSARFRYGVSATPWRDAGDDLLIDACFGRALADISASCLIDKQVLVPPTIYFICTSSPLGGTYASIYKECIVDNEARNNMIAEIALKFQQEGRKVLILVKQIKHGKILESKIPGSNFIFGEHVTSERKRMIDEIRNGGNRILIATSIFDEGIDVRPLDALILAGSGKSPTRALQRIGRVIRCFEGKKDAIVVDFDDDVKYLRNHSRARKKIYATEKLFKIKRIRPENPIVR